MPSLSCFGALGRLAQCPDLIEDRPVADLLVVAEQQYLADDLAGHGLATAEGDILPWHTKCIRYSLALCSTSYPHCK